MGSISEASDSKILNAGEGEERTVIEIETRILIVSRYAENGKNQ